MKFAKIFLFFILGYLMFFVHTQKTFAMVTQLSPHSWDSGLYATNPSSMDSTHAWGMRQTQGAWGTGPVNYQSGTTTNFRANSSGTLNVDVLGTYCPNNNCSYGSGTGYKALVQFWNDPSNYIAFGLIHDPGVSPQGTTLMVEGAANGQPVGGYWPSNGMGGYAHHFQINWTSTGISLIIDNKVTLGAYPVAESNPSISFLGAARNTGDIDDATFQNISFSTGSVNLPPVTIPSGSPYFTFTDTLTENGSGTGYSAYINAHDASSNAVSVGIQSDQTDINSNGAPTFIWEAVQNGTFSHQYITSATNNPTTVTLSWWKNSNMAVFYVNNSPLADIQLVLVPRLFFQVEGDGRLEGDSVNDTFGAVNITVGDTCPQYCGLNGSWNTNDFNYFGLKATNTNSQPQNGATFTVTGTVSGLASNLNWDSQSNPPVAGIGMIAQYWNGQ